MTVNTFYVRFLTYFTSIVVVILVSGIKTASAQPYGKGVYNANVPYGSQTSLAIATSGSVNIQVTPTDAGVLGTANGTVTVTSLDVVGYKLYVRSLTSTDMTNGAAILPTSANGTPATLATNTWGYNIDGSSNFTGMSLTDALIRTRTGPFSTGDVTTFTYGVKVDNNKAAGAYTTTIVYTAVPQTD